MFMVAVVLYLVAATHFVLASRSRAAADGWEWVTNESDDSPPLRRCEFWEVSASVRKQAVELLATNRFVPISMGYAKTLCSELRATSGVENAYLARGLAETPLYPLFQTTEFTQCVVYDKEKKALYSSFMSLHDRPSTKWPVVVVLPSSNRVERMVGVLWYSTCCPES